MIDTPKTVDQGSWSYHDIIGQRSENAPLTMPRTIVASGTVSKMDDMILVNASSGALTMTLETAQGADGRRHAFIKTDATANAMIVAGAGAETVNGAASVQRLDQYGVIKVASDGTNWNADYVGPGTAAASGKTTVTSGSFPAASTFTVSNIPQTGAYLVIAAKGMSSGTATRRPFIAFSTSNALTFDLTAGNYVGAAAATVIDATLDLTAAQTADCTVVLYNYQADGGYPSVMSSYYAPAVETAQKTLLYIGTTGGGINAVRWRWSGSGNFDAGTFEVSIFN